MEDDLIKIGYCVYCKNRITSKDTYVVVPFGGSYHIECYNQEHTYTEDLSTASYYEA